MDKATWAGLLIGFGGIILGNLLEGGHMGSLMQGTAAVIVLAGTLGATLVSNTSKNVKTGFNLASKAFQEEEDRMYLVVNEIVDYARTAKKESLMALEPKLNKVSDPLLREVLRTQIDGADIETTRQIFEGQIDNEEEELLSAAKIWSDAGGFAPTIGILGAVLGLIHVMGNLTDTSKLGAGIAVAFVATVYGVGFANLLFLPLANKIKKNIAHRIKEKRIILEGGLLVNSPLNPNFISQKLKAHSADTV